MADNCDLLEEADELDRDPVPQAPVFTPQTLAAGYSVNLGDGATSAVLGIAESEQPEETPPEFGFLSPESLDDAPGDYIVEEDELPAIPGEPDYSVPSPLPPDIYEPPPPGLTETFLPDQTLSGTPPPTSQQVQAPDSDLGENAPYGLYGCTTEYLYDSGYLHLPVAQEPTEAVPKVDSILVRTHAPIGKKIVRYFAERAGAQPLVPLPDLDDPNAVLLTGSVIPAQPRLDSGATNWIYSVTATYVYALQVPVTHSDGFAAGVPAYSTLTGADTFLDTENFVANIAT